MKRWLPGSVIVLAIALGGTSCDFFWGKQDVPLYCDETVACDYPDHPLATYCDIDGSMQGVARTCIELDEITCDPTMMSMDCPEDQPICDPAGLTGPACRPCDPDAANDECVDNGKGHCAPDGRCVECLSADASEHCPMDAPICAGDACQACMDNPQCEEQYGDEGRTRCTDDGRCVECEAHDDCGSQVCDTASSLCVPEGEIIYVDGTNGVDGPTCGSLSEPCRSIGGGGLAKLEPGTRETIKLLSDINESLDLGGMTARILGPAAVIGFAFGVPVVRIHNGSNVVLEDVTITGAPSGANSHGVLCEGSGSESTLLHVTISDNDLIGLKAAGCAVTVERSTIMANQGGGIDLSESSFSTCNNMIAENGDGGNFVGGVRIFNTGPVTEQVFEFNTVVNNTTAISFTPGVDCGVVNPITASNNIVYFNTGDGTNVSGGCAWTYSNLEDEGVAGEGNIYDPPMFAGADDYHLTMDSPARNAADPAAIVTVDFEGDSRPMGGRSDMGADEFVE